MRCGVDQAARALEQRHVHADHIRAREQIIERERLLHRGGQLPGALHGDQRIVAQHLHAERLGTVGDLDTDRPEPDHAERAARQLESHIGLLALLDRRIDGLIVAFECAGESPGLTDIASRQEQRRDHELLDRIGVGTGGVEHRNAAPAELGDRNVVGAGAGTCDRQHRLAGSGILCMSAERTRIASRLADLRADLIARARQTLEPARADVVECEDAIGCARTLAGSHCLRQSLRQSLRHAQWRGVDS